MKRLLILALMPLLAPPTLAANCPPVESFQVNQINYKARSAEESLHRLLRATPYQGVFETTVNSTVKARRLAGPLSKSLNLFATQTKTHWQQDGCQLRFVDQTIGAASALPITPKVASVTLPANSGEKTITTWTLRAESPIHVQFAEWAQRAGWHFEWKLEKSWRVPAATQFSGTFDEALAQAVEGLYAEGKPVRLILWEGNRFAEIVDVDAK